MIDLTIYGLHEINFFKGFLDNIKLKYNISITDNLNNFLETNDKKISIIEVPADIMCGKNQSLINDYINGMLPIINNSDLSIIVLFEAHDESEKILLKIDQYTNTKNVIAMIGYFYNDYVFQNIKVLNTNIWPMVSCEVVNQIPEVQTLLAQLTPYEPKDKLFDVLLGIGEKRIKPHRHFLYDMINNSSLKDKVIMNFRGDGSEKYDKDFLLDEEGYEPLPINNDAHKIHSSRFIKLFGHKITIAKMIPFNVYKKTTYSVVAETRYVSETTIFSEKTYKPIIAKRLFIMFAGKNYLKNLRSLGFQTFDGIIDETYDTIDDNYVRWALAFNQMIWLSKQDQSQILDQAKVILEHNASHIKTLNFEKDFNYVNAGLSKYNCI